MKPVLLDTGFLVALVDRSERFHDACVEALADLPGAFATCEAVIAESLHLLRRWPNACEAVLENVARGDIRINFNLESRIADVKCLMNRYRQVPMDFADACLVSLAGELKTGRILTLDQDFSIYRWGGRHPFELLIPL